MKNFDYFIGIDVSKLKSDVTVLFSQHNKTEKVDYQVIDNNEKSILSFLKKLLKDKISSQNVLFCFENTGIYSMPLACVLSEQNIDYCEVAALEIKRSKGICRGKSDKADAKDIAFYALSHLHKLHLSKISSTVILKLRLLFTEREKIIKSLASFQRTAENKDFCSKEVYKSVESINKSIVNQLNTELKKNGRKINGNYL